jgi:hypothetical protein
MLKQPQRVKLESDQDIVRVVRSAMEDGDARILERDGEAVAVVLSPAAYAEISGRGDDDIWAGYDPEKLLRAFDRASGIFKGVDTDQLIKDIYEARGQDSSGRPAD